MLKLSLHCFNLNVQPKIQFFVALQKFLKTKIKTIVLVTSF